MPTATFKRTRRLAPGPVFWSVAVPMAAAVLLMVGWAGYLMYLSLEMLSDLTGLHAAVCGVLIVLCLGSLSVNGTPRALLPAVIRTGLGRALVWGTVGYQLVVNQWPAEHVALLALPMALFSARTVFQWLRKR